MIIIATKELITKQPNFQHEILADINNLELFHKELLKTKKKTGKIEIYDIGKFPKTPQKTITIKEYLDYVFFQLLM